jgi:hypothetical protein
MDRGSQFYSELSLVVWAALLLLALLFRAA